MPKRCAEIVRHSRSAMACRRVSTSRRSLISRDHGNSGLPFSAAQTQLTLMASIFQYGSPRAEAQVRHPCRADTATLGDRVLILCRQKLTSRAWILRNFASASATKRVLQPFSGSHQHVFAFAVRGPDLPPPENLPLAFSSPLLCGLPCSGQLVGDHLSALRSSATASQAIPSRGRRSRASVVVAFTLTSSIWQPRSSAIKTRICGICGSIFGARAIIVTSTLPSV